MGIKMAHFCPKNGVKMGHFGPGPGQIGPGPRKNGPGSGHYPLAVSS